MDIGDAVAAFGDESLRLRPARSQEARVISSLEVAELRPVGRPTQLVPRRQIDARPAVDIGFAIGGPGELVRAIPLGEHREPTAVEFHPCEVNMVGALGRIAAREPQNEGAALLVDLHHAPHYPLPRGDRRRGTGGDVDGIKMMPAAPLAAPKELPLGGESVEPGPVDPVDEGIALLVDDRRDASGGDIDPHDPHNTVAALVVSEEKRRAIREPQKVGDLPGGGEERFVERHFGESVEIEQMGKALVDPVPRLVVAKLDHARLWLVFRRRLDDCDGAVLPLAELRGDHPPAVRRDEAFVGEMEVLCRSAREWLFGAVGTLRHEITVAEDHLGVRRAGGGLCCPGPALLA